MSKTRGRVTLPSESGFLNKTRELMERWGADAIRDSDGTKLDKDVKSLDAEIYTTYFVARGHNEFAVKHMEECQQLYLMSRRFTAVGNHLEMDFMEGYFGQQVVPDCYHDPKKWWEVMDRTTGEPVPVSQWKYDREAGDVVIETVPYHQYSVPGKPQKATNQKPLPPPCGW